MWGPKSTQQQIETIYFCDPKSNPNLQEYMTIKETCDAGDAGEGMSPDARDVFSSAWKQSGHNRTASSSSMMGSTPPEPPLDPKLLPFSKGPLSFGVGVNLKMAVSRWTDWAHDAGVREEKGVLEG